MHHSKIFICILTFLAMTGVSYTQSGWIQTQLNPGMGRSLYATDTEIYAATSDGVYSTLDNGMPWFSKGLTGHDVSDVIKSHQYILAATLDGVYRSSDNGTTWQLTNGSPGISAGGGIYGPHVFANNDTYVFVIAWARGIFRSSDDGANWEQVYVGQIAVGYQDYAAMAKTICVVGTKIFINGSGPFAIYSSSDNGNTWVGSQFSNDLQALYYDNGKLFACGSMGVYLSTDLGNSWTTQYSNTIGDHGELIGLGTFRNIISYNQNLIAAVDFNSIYISADNGISWTSFKDGLITDWTFIGLAIKPPYIWALRDYSGNAYRRSLTEIVTEVDENKILPTWFSLLQNYPNPFNPSTIIRYALPSESKVTLTIYNLLGQAINELVNDTKSAGYHEVIFNASNLASGIYFYWIVATALDGKNNFADTKKLILMK